MDLRKLKDKATEAFTKGKFAKAAQLYQEYCEADTKDLQAKLRMGDAWAKAGDKPKAIVAYTAAAEGYARDGFLPRAIAASKLIVELDPTHKGVQKMLAELYARKAGPSARPASSTPPPSKPHERESATFGDEQAINPMNRKDAIELPPEEDQSNEEIEIERPGVKPAGRVELEIDLAKPIDLSDELPPELRTEAAAKPPEPPPPPPPQSPPATPPVASAAFGGGPPGLRPRRDPEGQPAEPSRIWLPPGFKGSGEVPASQPPPLSRFDELDLDLDQMSALSPPLSQNERGGGRQPGSVSSFTEIDPMGDSLLHAVEAAALAGIQQRGDMAEVEDEIIELPEELGPGKVGPGELPKIPLFSDLSPDAFIELFERCPLRRYAKGERVIEQGTLGQAFYVICDGDVRVFRDEEGQRQEIAVLHDGSFFGEMALLSGAPRTASVEVASEQAQLLEISASVLTELSRRYPQVSQALKKFCRQRLLSNVMSTSALFKPFSRDDRKDLVRRFRARDVGRNEVVIREGEQSDGMYVVLSGEVEVKKNGQNLAKLKEGEIFGEMSLLEKAPASATVSAARRTSLLRLPREDFNRIILSHPQILVLVSELSDDRRKRTEAVLSGVAQLGEEGLMLV
ncbi:MAG: cyclic nucleotide-binding domain-containing protein [Myxococcota bacterium]